VKLWRISNYADLYGIGGTKVEGRWHNKGIPIVYLSESPALAMLEALVNFELSPDEVPENYQLLEVDCPEPSMISDLNSKALSDDWTQDKTLTRNIGDQWLTSMSSGLLKVPSAVVPYGFNYLLNPRHPASTKMKIESVREHPYDPRLFNKN